jgi:hypothetical protein
VKVSVTLTAVAPELVTMIGTALPGAPAPPIVIASLMKTSK